MIRFLVAGVVLLVAGCDAAPGPNPPGPTTTVSATSTNTPASTTTAAPRPTTPPAVTQPVSIDRFAKRACDSLTVQQVESLGLTGMRQLPATDLCRWSEGEAKTFDVAFIANTNPLVNAYGDRNDFWLVFEPMTIGGLPALKRQSPAKPPVFDCVVTIATSADQGIKIDGLNTGPAVDWCAKAVQAAEFVVQNLRR